MASNEKPQEPTAGTTISLSASSVARGEDGIAVWCPETIIKVHRTPSGQVRLAVTAPDLREEKSIHLQPEDAAHLAALLVGKPIVREGREQGKEHRGFS